MSITVEDLEQQLQQMEAYLQKTAPAARATGLAGNAQTPAQSSRFKIPRDDSAAAAAARSRTSASAAGPSSAAAHPREQATESSRQTPGTAQSTRSSNKVERDMLVERLLEERQSARKQRAQTQTQPLAETKADDPHFASDDDDREQIVFEAGDFLDPNEAVPFDYQTEDESLQLESARDAQRGKSRTDSKRSTAGAATTTGAGRAKPAGAARSKLAQRSTAAARAKSTAVAESERDLGKDYTFKPAVRAYQGGSRQPRANLSLDDRIAFWHRDNHRKLRQRELAHKAAEDAKLQQYPFKPQINAPRPGSPGAAASSSSDPRATAERLHHEADTRIVEREKRRRAAEEAEIARHGFKPTINASSRQKVADPRPIHQRVGELQKGKAARLSRLRQQLSEESDLAFQPEITPASRAIAEQRESKAAADTAAAEAQSLPDAATDEADENSTALVRAPQRPLTASERLASDANAALERRLKRQAQAQQAEAAACTFKPEVNATSQKIVQTLGLADASFLERQQAWVETKRTREAVRAHVVAEQETTFKPDTGKADLILANSRLRHTYASETEEERIQRLSSIDSARLEAQRERLAAEQYAECTFAPRISETSKRIVAALPDRISPADDAAAALLKKRGEQMKAQAEQQFAESHPFKPRISATSKVLAGHLEQSGARVRLDVASAGDEAFLQALRERDAAREAKLQQARQVLESRQLEQCTFAPNTQAAPPVKQPTGPVLIRGMAGFLERKQLAKRMEEEKQAREAQVFFKDVAAKPPRMTYTVPKPFKLNTERRLSERPATASKSSAAAAGERELASSSHATPFKPVTNESRNRELIQGILAESEAQLQQQQQQRQQMDDSEQPDAEL